MDASQIIIRPVVSEKSFVLAEAGKYTFRVADKAHKTQIRQAIEPLCDVKVVEVRTSSVKSKPKRRGLPAALGLGLDRRGADLDHLDVAQRLDRLTDLGLVRLVGDAEGVLAGLGEHEGLLRDDRADDDLACVHQLFSSAPAPLA